jgi:hypothetical protein
VGGLPTQRFLGRKQAIVELYHAFADVHPGEEFVNIEGLGEIVVRASVETFDNVGGGVLGCEQQDVLVVVTRSCPETPADLGTCQARHHPVQHKQAWGVGRESMLQGLQTIAYQLHNIALAGEEMLQRAPIQGIVFRH